MQISIEYFSSFNHNFQVYICVLSIEDQLFRIAKLGIMMVEGQEKSRLKIWLLFEMLNMGCEQIFQLFHDDGNV